ncbi:MAG: acyl-CoA thioesterase [Oscillospiraceae bacterium]|nr:acyl-CoA thioesterase [Oscillospiraceae bacterium]
MTPKPLVRKANFYETDQMGIIHHSNYIRWFEEARVDFMEQIGYGFEKAVQMGIDNALTGLSCEYKSMVRFGDVVEIQAVITELKNARMSVSYEVRDLKTGVLCATGKTSHCFIDSKKMRPVSLKKAIPELYALFESTIL